MIPSSKKDGTSVIGMFNDVRVVADGDSDIVVHDDSDGVNESLQSKNIFLPSRARKKSTEKKLNKKDRSVSTAEGGRYTLRPVDLMCGQITTDANSTVGVDVSCGAMNAFSKDVPYNSAGLSLVSPVDTNPGGFLSQNTRRRRRPTRISSMPASPTVPDNDIITVHRRLRTSDVNLPTRSRVSSFRTASPGVERFNYAKALLRSDHELEKLSRKIRSEINESELFELAQAAEKAADLGVDNFTGRASTFEGELRRQRQDELEKRTNGLPPTNNRKQVTGSNMTMHSNLAKIPRSMPARIRKSKPREVKGKELDDNGKNAIAGLDQSLLDHARAAAAAVAVSAPAVQLQTSARKLIRKEPQRRSMGIDSLRDVNEVIPRWKELHGHMRTHFYRANVETNSLFFCETKTLSPPSNNISDKVETKEKRTSANHERRKSFFGNLTGMKLLPDFRPKESPQNEALNNQSRGDSNELRGDEEGQSDTLQIGNCGSILSSRIPPKKEDFGKIQSSDHCVPQELVDRDEKKEFKNQSFIQEANADDLQGHLQGQVTSLTPRLPERSESFDREVLQITKEMPPSPERQGNVESHDGDGNDSDTNSDTDSDSDDNQNYENQRVKNSALGSSSGYQNGYTDSASTLSVPKGGRESSISSPKYEPLSPVSPSHNSVLGQSSPRFGAHSSATAPSTPKSNVVPRRKDSGFSTPAHLRIIKRLHSVSSDNVSANTDCLDDPKPEAFEGSKLEDDLYISTPATGVYSQFEPNSIVQNSSGRSPEHLLAAPPSLEYAETNHLAIPTIQSLKSGNEPQKFPHHFSRRNVRTHSKSGSGYTNNSSTSPTTPVQSMSLSSSKEKMDGNEDLSSGISNQSESGNDDDANGDSRSSSSSNIIGYINPPHEVAASQSSNGISLASGMQDNTSEKSTQNVQCDKGIDEKKECDSETSTLNLNPYMDKEKEQSVNRYVLGLPRMPNVEESEGQIRRKQSLSPDGEGEATSLHGKKNCDLQCSPLENQFVSDLRKRIKKPKNGSSAKSPDKKPAANSPLAIETIDSNYTAESKDFISTHAIRNDDRSNQAKDLRNLETSSVCHSIPQTEVSFKTAVQTVQGVAVQTVQEVFSHLSLGSPRNELETKELQSERENKEFLSNYFYCSKSVMGQNLRLSSVEDFNVSETDVERLVCVEPCNARESPCYLFGIDTMCGGLIDLLPNDGKREQLRHDTQGDLSRTPTRDRTSSISTGQIHRNRLNSHTGANSYQERDEGNWLEMFQKAASERLNLQFQTEENELEKSKHPYTPPFLSRRLPNPSNTL